MSKRDQQEQSQELANLTMNMMASAMLELEGKFLSQHQVSLKQLCLLAYLARGNTPTMTEIHRSLGVSTAAITGCVDRLEEDGFAKRIRKPGDRRVIMVEITPKGRVLITQATGCLEGIYLEAIVADGRPKLDQVPTTASKRPMLSIPLRAITGVGAA